MSSILEGDPAHANAEGPPGESTVTRACSDSQTWLRDLFTELARRRRG